MTEIKLISKSFRYKVQLPKGTIFLTAHFRDNRLESLEFDDPKRLTPVEILAIIELVKKLEAEGICLE